MDLPVFEDVHVLVQAEDDDNDADASYHSQHSAEEVNSDSC